MLNTFILHSCVCWTTLFFVLTNARPAAFPRLAQILRGHESRRPLCARPGNETSESKGSSQENQAFERSAADCVLAFVAAHSSKGKTSGRCFRRRSPPGLRTRCCRDP